MDGSCLCQLMGGALIQRAEVKIVLNGLNPWISLNGYYVVIESDSHGVVN